MTLDPNIVESAAAGSTPASAPNPAPASGQAAPTDGSASSAQPAQPAEQPQGAQPVSSAAPVAQAAPDSSAGSSAGSILKGILMGALHGAAKVTQDVGHAAGEYTAVGQDIQARRLERQEAQQRMGIEQKSEERAEQTQDHTNQDWKITHNNLAMAALHTAFENHASEEAKNAEISAANSGFITSLQSGGVPAVDVKTFQNLTKQDAQGIANGSLTPVAGANGGANAGIHLYNTDDLKNHPLTAPMTIKTDWQIDPKTGALASKGERTLPVGTDLYDAWQLRSSELAKGQTLQSQFEQNQKVAETAATIAGTQAKTGAEKTPAEVAAESKSEANKNNAEAAEKSAAAALTRSTIPGAGATNPNDPAFPKALADARATLTPEAQKTLDRFPANTQSLFIQAAHGFIDPKTFSATIRKGGLGMTAQQAKEIMLAVNPADPTTGKTGYTDGLYGAVQKTLKDFSGDGKEGQSIRSFNQFLVHGQELKHVSEQLQRTGSPVLNTPLNKINNQMFGEPGVPEMMTAIAAARSEWSHFIESGHKPDADQAKYAEILMNENSSPAAIMGVLGVMGSQAVGRLDQINETYKTAMGVDYPNLISQSGRAAANELGIGHAVQQYQTGGTLAGGNKAPNISKLPPNVPAGVKQLGHDAQGNVTGYVDPQTNKYVSLSPAGNKGEAGGSY